MLQSYGVSLNTYNSKGQSVLGYALARGSIDAFMFLLSEFLADGLLTEEAALKLHPLLAEVCSPSY